MRSPTKHIVALGLGCLAASLMIARTQAHDGLPGERLAALDANDDGTVSAAEFAAAGDALAADLQARFLERYDAIPTGQTAGDGTITTAEAKAVFEARAADWVDHLLDTLDTNDDGAISDADTVRGRRHPGRRHLEEYDANDDGTISNAELLAAAAAKVDAQLASFLEKYDAVPTGATSGDGTITPDESLAVHEAIAQERIDAILERFDANDDGAVTEAEIDAVVAARPGKKGQPGGRGRG